jgi:glycosyltransferase involved in cell wall biosynthesis
MTLGFHYHIPAVEKGGVIFTSGFLGVFLDSLSLHVDELVCFMHTPLESEEFLMDYALKSRNIRLVSMGPHLSVPRRLLNSNRIVTQILPEVRKLDLLLIRCPTPLLPAFAIIRGTKKAYLIVGDYQKSSRDLRQPFLRKAAIRLWAAYNKFQQNRAIKEGLVFVNNGLIYEELKGRVPNLRLVRTTTLRSSDFFHRQDTCQSGMVNLLYTGRLDLSKGLQEIIEALSQMRLKGINMCLHLVGWEEKNSLEVTRLLQSQARSLGISDCVFFHGKKQVGDELNYFYRMADIFIIGSKVNEGFPRTIWEAFANSLPVIASAVGSIPYFLRDNVDVFLIRPARVDDMTSALFRLVHDRSLRMTLIRNAYKIAEENTLEFQAELMTMAIKEFAGVSSREEVL